MTVAIIQYNTGNTCSVQFALERLGVRAVISSDPDTIRAADKVIFPGVGAAAAAMRYLESTGLDHVIRSLTQPVLGICLGMQLLCRHSEEGDTRCLDIIDMPVKKFRGNAKIPQVGWNQVSEMTSPLFRNIAADSNVYFVHSYYVPRGACTIGITDYILPYSAALRQRNFYGVQFHPEKSGAAGQAILSNFLDL